MLKKICIPDLYGTAIFAFLYLPIIVLIALSFNDSRSKVKWVASRSGGIPAVFRTKDYDCICHNFAGHFPVRNYFHTDRNTCRARHSRHEKTAPDHLSRRDQYSASECDIATGISMMLFVCEILSTSDL